MNCCDDNGKCHGGAGCAARTVRSCDELGLCQGHTPRCAGCSTDFSHTARGAFTQSDQTLSFAPGVLEGYRVGLLGTQAQRRELKRWLLPALAFTLTVAVCALAAGVIAGRWL